jgi:hypothetical protein
MRSKHMTELKGEAGTSAVILGRLQTALSMTTGKPDRSPQDRRTD